ncbi:cell wall associated fibronectin-binding protein [Staphylococcus aureus]|nr:cell wall associated fibronectin-binding protein [Staphylococcus aureus]
MNYRDKIQKFSIRKYTVGTFSTVIATLVFLGFNTSQAHAAETNQPASVVKQKQQSNNEQTENRESQVQNSQNSQNGQSLSATHENEQPNISQANLVDQKVAQSSTTNDEQPASQNVNTKKDSATAATTQPDKEQSKHKQNESQSANKNGNDNRAAHVENHEANVVTASDSSDNGNVQHDRNELQAFFDANYHDYRFIDRENADSGTFNYVKGIFDKINTLLGSNDPINNKDLQLAYKELEQAVALIRTMPQRQQTSRRSNRIQTRSVESRAAEPRSVSDYQNANSSYYVENANDGSGYPVGTYINASSKGAPYNLPTTPWNTLKASDSKEIALMTAKQTGDGYQWVIKFNKGHAPHQNMIFWFALPADQVPVGRTDFVTVNSDGTNVQWSHGAGAGANKPLQQMWEYGVNDPHRSHDFKIRNRSGQVIYDWPTVHIYSLEDLSRASDYFSEAGATPATKAFGRQNFEYINGQKPAESPGVPKVYTFIGQGDASYTISFKTQGPTVNKLYYAAGGRALEYNQLFMYSQLYVESTQDHQQRLNGLRQVVNRTYRIGTTKRVEVSQGNVQTKKVLESTNLNIDDFVDDPLSYVKTPSNKVLGFYSNNANTNAFRPGGAQQLNEYQLSQLFTDQKLQEAARTRNPIRLMIGFDYPDAYGNSETLVPVNLTVLPEIQHNIKFFKNDDTQNIAEKPFSKQAGHPVFYVYAGNQGNASVNLGGSVTSIQPLRINLTSNENFTDKDWQITGIPRTLHIENSTNRPNNARERNIELVGNLLPGDYFGTIRFGRKEQLFEIRVKPHTPTITTTAEQLRGTALQKVPVNISGIPLDPSALVYLVAPTNQTTNGGSEADQIPSGYTILATGTPDGVHNTITIRPQDYIVFIPPVGKQIRAVVYYNKVVASNMSNAVTILPDDIPPTINNPVGINAKYYRGDEVNFTMGVSDRHSGIKNTTITTLPNGWTSNLTKADKNNGSLSITGRVSMNQAFNSDITFKVSATDNVNNTTNDSQSKHVSIHVGKISEDAHPIVLGNTEKVVVVNPTAVSNDEKQSIITAFMNKNQNIRGYLASTDPVTVDNNGNVTLHYRDGSSTTLDATNVMTYEPVVKPEYQTVNAAKTATVTIAKGQSFSIGDIKQYFTLSNGQPIPSGTFTNITSDRTIPTAQEVSQMNAGTQLYHITATNAYHKDSEDFYISLKIIDVKQPEGDQRVYRTSTYDLTTDEISKVKQAFINANRDVITLAEGDISVTNTPNGANVSTITVNINKGRLTKSFASNLANMNFLRWVNFPQDYTVTWTNAKIANRPTDGGLSWSDDHKSLIYRYDATLGTQITTNDILTMLKATTTVPGLRNNITGNEKSQAEAGGRPNFRTTGYSQSNATTDGQRQFTLNGQVIQVLDIINPSNGYGGQPVTNSNTRANHSNSTVVNVNEPAANGAGAFTIDHVVKSNSTHNASDAVYKAQLYLTPYGPKQYVEHLNQNTGNTTDAINIYFVPSDLVNPTISVGNYTNHQVFSGETFTNTITANDNFGVQSVTVPNTSQITGTVDNNHQHVSATAPNVTSATNKTINLLATDTSGNTATTSFNVTVKPLRDKYRVGTSSTAANPVRIANISNNATVSQADQTTIINSLTFTETVPNRSYARASANEITSKTVSNVSRTGNNANVTVTVTYQDGTTSTVTVPVKHVIPEIVAHSHYTVQGQDFPAGNGSSASDYFKLSNGSDIADATITWVSGQAPNKDNTRIGEDITVTAHILIDGETTPITKTATYKVVRTVPKHVFETARGVLYPGVSDMYDAKQYVKPVNNSWSTNAQHMNFQFVGTYGPNKDVVGISTRLIRVTYDNRQTEDLTILSKVKPDPPRIDANSVTYKAGLTNQEIKVNNVLNNSSVKLFKADNTPLNVTNITHGSGFSSVVTVSDALPNGGIKAKSSISMNNVTYTTQDEHGQVVTVTRNESVDSNDSATVTVTPQLQATTEGAVFIKGGDGFDFGHVERFIQNPPHGATVAWHDSPDTWKNTVGNTHKTAVVTLPNGQGTRNVEVPVKVYPVANAKAPSRDVKGQNLTNGTDAMNYITFDPNTNTNGITAAWANRQQPNNQQAGVQHLNVDVTYPGISAAKRVPVTVNVYQFEFPQTTYTTTVGGTLASGTQASGYAHMQNATGLPTDGFTYKWNRDTTGTNDANWSAMNKPNVAKVVNAKYDVIYNGHTFATSLPAKFVVKDVQPAKPTVTETAAGAITIAPGANQTVNTHAGNVTTYADKLVIKRNGNVVTTFTRRNNTSPWVKEASAATVAGIAGTNNGITVAAGTFNPADTIQVVATQGSGETVSDEQRSDDFTVVAPQPNQATTKIWQNGHIDITPNNPSGHLINPTQAMDIAYTEKVGNGAEHSKTINVVRGQNNQWTIANKPDYVTLDAQTGKVTFNANTIKPNSSITITPKAGTGHSVSSNPSTLTAPAAHTVNTTEIVKDYGSNVTAAEINNAVQVANKRTATIKNGTAMPTNLAGGSTTTIPVTVTYNDGSTEEVQESIFTKADKRELITAKNHLDDPVSTEGKKPGTITQYNNAMHNAQQQINTAKTEAQQVINNERATPQQVSDALTKVRAAQTKIDQAKALLQNKEDNSQLVTSKNNLQSSVNQVPSTAGMTQQSIDNYNAKKREAETEITAAQRVIDNGDATAQQISDEKHRVDNALTALNQAKHDLTADTHALEQAVQQLNRTGTTTGKKPASITAYNNSIRALQSDLTSAKNSANAIIQKPIRTVQEVQSALTNVNRVNERLTQAINQLVPLADNSALKTAKTKLDEEINKSVTTDGMTQSSIQAYENAKRAGQTESTNAQNVINNGDATDQQIAAEKTKVEEKYNSLKQAIAGLTPDLAPLQTAKTQLQNDIDQPTSTTGMTSASIAAFNEKLSAARTKIQEIDRVLASHPDVATIRQNVTAANAAKSALDQARNGLTVDKAPLENAKNQLQHSIDTQTSTTGMTQDSINAYNAKLTAARNKIQQINQVLAGSPTVEQINTNTSTANQAKSDLDHARQALTPDKAPLQTAKTQLEQSINQPTDTTGMTTASLNAYNQKLQAARQKLTEINQVLNGNPTVQNINDKVTEANQAKDQLNTARQGLTLDRQPALTTLHGASNLNQAQQNNFTQQINAAQNHAALETIKSNITALNTAMTKLKDSVADNNTIKSDQNYTDATPANKQAYDNAVNAAKGVIGETTNPTMDVNTVNQKAASVKSTKDALDGQQNLQRAKTEATNAITHASDLNQAQKNALTQQVNSAQNVQAVNDIKQTTQSLNTAMTGLKRGVANHNQVVQSDNYVNADTNKKNDYNNAYNHANDIINGNAQHPVITPSDVNNALSNVTSKEHALNGEAKLNAAKQEANTALGHLNNLNNAQRQNLQSQINGAHQIDAVNTIKQNATNLNSAMGNLRQAVADKDQVKRTEDYADADTAKQNAYNSAVSSAETIINQTTNPTMSVDDVNRATSAVTSNKNALNGYEKLAQSKTDAARAIDALPHLNNAQKADVKSKINAASNIAGVNTVKQQGTDLNTAMGNLQGAINDEQTTLNSQNYQDATPSKKTAYTNAVQAAKDILNKSNGQNKTKDQVTEAMNQVNSAKNNLDGTRLLDQAKQTAKQQLNNMTHLTTAQKDKLKQQVQQAQNVAGVDTVKSSANTLNGAMGTLRNSIQDNTATKNGQNYLDATERNKTNYNNAVDSANGVINATSNPNMDANAINQIATQVTSTKNALDGTHNLTQAKQTATNAIDGATNLNKAQKDALKAQVTSAQRVANVTSIQQTANELNTAMGQLQHGIDDENATKQTQKYRDAEQSKKTAYDQAVAAAKAILNKQTGSNSDKAAVDRALQQVTSTKDALNGDAKLAEAKAAAKQNLGTLNHITNAQRTDLEGQINQATTVDGVNTVKTNANTLDGAMNSLQGSINDKDATLRNQNYLDADESKRNAYTQAVTAAEGILNKQTGGNTSKADVDNALNAVTRAKAALNGADNLRNAKTSATNMIDGLPNLTQLQKDNLKHQVEQAQNVAGVNGVKDKGNTLNTAMGALRTSIQNDNTTKTSQNYLDASDSNKNNYNTAVNNANGVINATNNPNMDANAINGMANQVNTTKAALNGAQNLAQAKTNATNTINNAHDLNQKQKDALKTQVNNAQRVSDANNVQHTATELNSAMTALKAAIADKERTKASGNYVNADQEKRQAYDSKVTNAENIISGTPNATLTVNDVNSAASQVNAAKTALNGDNNLRVAKEHANNTIDGLAQLNNAQKAKLKEQVQSATTLDGVQTVKNSSQTLNTAMKGLRDSIANEATIKAGQNYTDASPNNRNEYDSAVTAAKAIINQTSNPTMEPNTITQVTSQVTTKEQALNGARNLAQAKTTAKNNLNNLTSINNAQKDALTRSIDGATTVAGVNQETAKATELNNAMHSLQNGINDETQTKQTQKYLDAEPSKKSAYDQAVNAAKAILTKASGQNVDKAAVEQALQNVNSTKTALNGDAKLNEAKAAAKQTLGTLTHINNAQRTALDNEITQATNVEGVNTVKAKAQQLDGAMGQLETSIRDKDTTLQSQNYQDADDAKRTAYSQAVNAAATILNKTAGGNTPKADVERAMQAVTQANTALNGIQNLDRAKQAANTAITNASDLNTKQKEALKAQVTSAGRVSAANGVEHTATELNTAMTALKRAIADKAETKASGNYVNADANKRQAYDEKVTAAENIVSGTPTPTLTPADVTNAATQVTNAKTQLNGNHNLEVAKQNANTAIDGLTSLNGPQKAKLKEQVGQATTLPNVQTVRDNAQTLNTAMKGLRDSIANEATIKAGQNYTDASQNKQTDYNSAVTAAKAIIGQTTSPSMNAQEINQAKDQVTAKQQALNGQENLRTAQTNAKQHLNGLSDLTDAQKDAVKRQIEGATHVNEVTQAQNNADALNTAMTNLKNGIQDQNTIKQGVNFTDADEAKRNAYTNAVTQAEQILNKAQGPNTSKDGVETALENVQRAKNELNGNQNVANAKTTAKNALNNLTSINNAQKEALKSQIEGATTVAGVNQVSTTASELNTAMSNLQNGINDEAATKAAQKYTDADREKQTAYNDAVTAAKTLLDKTAGSNDNKAAVEQALQRVNTAKTALNGDERLNEAKNTAKQQVATMSHLTDAQKANLTSQIESGTTVAGVQGIQANAGTLDQAMNQLRQSIASKDATKSSEDYQDANADLQNAYNDAVTNAEGIISATNNPEMNPDTINQKASQVNSAKSALNGDEKLAAAKQTAKSDIGRLTDLNNAQRTAANAEVDQAPNLAAVTAAKNKATSLNTAMGNLKHALAEKDNTKRSVNYTDADQPKQQAYDTAVTQAEAITNANGSNANETQVQAALNQLNQAKNDLNGDNKVAQAKESAKRALASYSNLNNAQSTAATSQIDNATTVAGVTAAQNTANELNTAMGQLQNGINDQNTVKQQVNFTDADQGKKDAYTNAVTNAQGILDKAHGQNMTKAQVEAALNQVTTAKNALNGDANVRQAKSDAKANLGTLTHLNNAQKQDLTSQIEGATTVNGVNGVKTKAQDLDGAMQRLQSAIANKDQTKASENYIDADPTKKTAFDNAITQAESYLNKDHGANKDKQAVEQAIQSVTSTENALNGDANLQRAKTEAIQAIDNLTHLNTPQKTALKQQVNAAQRVSGVTDLKNSATSLNNAMDQLKQAIADHDTIVASGNYTNASPDKQGAYTDAYNAAKNIVNGSPNVITNAADVTAATQRVNNAETGLNGDTNLATAKQQAKDALRQMTHLSDAQKQSITGQIDSATQVTGVQSVKDNATNLDNAMNQLRNSIANKDDVKASQPYVDADRDKQNAYNTAVTNAENIINATSQPTLDPSAVTQAANQVSTNKTALNGAQNLANKKQETTANINQLSHLNNAQKQDLNTQVTNAPNISTVNQVKTKAEQLDQAMERLINGIQDKDQVKQSVNFTDADPEKQTAYNNAVTAAENIINQANGTNANQSQVEAALSTVTTTKQALNGDRKVTDAKNNANQTLSTLDNLNNAQKGAVTGNINQAHTVAEVTQAIQTAQELNTAMGNLKNSLNDKDTTLGSQNFADADPEKKNAYNEAVHNAENILNKSTGTNVPKDQVEAAMNQVNATKAALNGTQNLEKAKQHANTAIDGLSHLTNAQKEALKQLVQQSTTVAEAQGNEQKANNVDAAMDKLRQSIADNATTKQNQNYTDASQNKKDAYNNAVTTAQGIIDQTTSPTLDPTVINQAAGQVSTTKNALNGNENLEAAKQQASQSLGSLDNLNNAQKQTVTDQINGAHTVDEANQIKQNAQNLNTAMGNLKQAIADKDATKATVNFTDADQAKQQAYNTAVTNAENIISKANGGNATQAEVEQAIKQVNAAKQALNGNANVQHAKDEATALINSSNDLNQAQKDALKQQVQNATTVAGVNNVKQTAQELNNAMTQLKQGIADKEQTKADGNFVNADPDKQNAYNQAVAKAEALISATPDVVVTPSEITAALNKVTQAKNDLNGNTNLATAKQNVQHAIDQLPNLNQAQRDEYSKQITQATLVPNVNAIQQAATTLNDAMTQLKQGIANKAQIKGSENYHDADTDKQTAYDNAVTKAEELLKQTTNPTMDPNTIQQALTKVNDTNQALNGNQKLADAKQDAKTTLGTLDHLNDAQKQALTTQVEQAPDIATVNNVKQNAQNLNNAMTNLNNALQDKTETLNSINFTDADQAKKDAYTNAVSHAEGILSKANGSNASQTEVEQAMQRVNEAKQALNGNDNVQRAKDAAKQVITNANDLNQAQKDALKQQVDAAQTVANVNTIKQTAQDLNQAMTQLKQGIADKDQTKANGNFVNADTDKQNAYNNAVAHAEQIISGTPNANVDPQQVAQALQQVNQAKGDLNGNHNLQVAKDNANTAIDQLPNLNQPQKTALKDQVSHAELVTGVNAIKQNADALNNAMGTLKQQIQANSQVPQSVDFTQADQDKQQAYNNAANQAQQIANGIPTPVLTPDTVTQAVTTMNQAKDALNGDEKLAQAKQEALANLDTLRDLNQPQRDALRNQINQAQALATVEQTKQNAQNVNTAMSNLKQGIANKDTVKASENYHDADADKQTAYTNAVSQAEGIINQTTNPTLNPDEITRALTQVTDAKNGLNGEAKLATEKQNAKDAVSGMTHLNDAQKQALKGQIDQSPEIATVNQVKQTATSLDQAMDQLSQAINDKAQTLADGNYLNADPDKQNAYKQAVAKAEALLNKQSGTNEVQAQVESITNEVNAAKQALNGNDNLANAKQQAKQQLANLTHLNDAQKQSFESQITQAPLVTDVTTINQKAQTLDHAMELLRNSVADNQTTLASEDYHDATAQRQNDYNQAVTAANNIINQTTSPTMNPDDVNGATTQVNNTKVALDGDENLAAAKQQANNRLDQLDHLNNAQKQQLQSQITQSSDIAAVNGHKQTAESLNTAMGNLINAIADHQAVEQRGNFINADTDKQTAYNTAVNEAAAMINKQTGQNANQTEVEQAITKVQTTLQALNGDHNLQVAKTNATQAIDALTSLNDPQKTALKDQVTAATLVTAVHQIEQNANTLNQAMHGLRQSIQDNAATKANSKYINEDQPEQQNYDQAVQAANNIINEQTATLDNNAINQAATTVNTTKAALHGDVKLQNDKDHAKQTVSQLAHLNNAQKHMEDTLIDSETTRTAVKQDLTEAQALDQLMDALQQSIADKDATRASSAYVNAEPNKKQSYDEAVQNAESIIAGLNNPTINKGNVSSATQAVISSKNALDGVERLAQDKQTAGNSLNHLDQLTPAQQQALENQINNATTRGEVAQKLTEAQALNQAMEALRNSIQDQQQTEAGSKFINEDKPQKDAYQAAVQNAKDLINQTNNPTLDKAQVEQLTQAVNQAKDNLHGDQKLADDKQHAVY